jgi:prepilin-type N-terminal cleavage/methylation domain-containing protein
MNGIITKRPPSDTLTGVTEVPRPARFAAAFTLIEMLVVIAIIGIVAAMVLTGGQYASKVKKETAVKATREKLQTIIDNYQAKLNFYPPDNGDLAALSPIAPQSVYEQLTATNALIYELTGVTNTNSTYAITFFSTPASPTISLASGDFPKYFNRTGVANADSTEPQNFFNPPPAPKDYTNYPGSDMTKNDAVGLLVPALLVQGQFNFWHYDASSPRRHNQNSYDLWAEFLIGTQNGKPVIETNGNW